MKYLAFYLVLATAITSGLGIATYCIYTSNTTVDHIHAMQKFIAPAGTSLSSDAILSELRMLKAILVQSPEIKKTSNLPTFSWRRDIFDPINNHIASILTGTPNQKTLAKVLSLVDTIVDEFEHDGAGIYYNAEIECTAQIWRNDVYDAIALFLGQTNTLPTPTRNNRQAQHPLARRTHNADVQQKMLLQKPPLNTSIKQAPNALQPLQGVPEADFQRTGSTEPTSFYGDQSVENQVINDAYDEWESSFNQNTIASHKNTAIPSSRNNQVLASQAGSPSQAASTSQATPASSKKMTNGSTTSSTSTEQLTSDDNDPETMTRMQELDKQKKALEELQKIMFEFKEHSKAEQNEANIKWLAAMKA